MGRDRALPARHQSQTNSMVKQEWSPSVMDLAVETSPHASVDRQIAQAKTGIDYRRGFSLMEDENRYRCIRSRFCLKEQRKGCQLPFPTDDPRFQFGGSYTPAKKETLT